MNKINLFIFLIAIIFSTNYSYSDERICFDTKNIENIKFKKDFLIFENRKDLNYTVTCKGNRHLTFQSPLVIEPQKMGYKICSNDVLKLKEYSCFIDKIELLVEEDVKY
tara:strand:- start:371 stop:697 length:327 start_codon:yes stop_codon:yes gene_type:complete